MENASKALIIAGAILITILIISLGVFVFQQFAGTARESTNMDEQLVRSFNADLTPYLGEKISGSQVNVLIQQVRSINKKAEQEGDSEKTVEITFPGGSLDIHGDFNPSNVTKVATGGKFYQVEATYGNSGLIKEIRVRSN